MTTTGDRPPDPPATDALDQLRTRSRLYTLVTLIVVGLVLCAIIAYPFLPALTWAMALAVMAFPIHDRLTKFIPNANGAAGLSTAVVVLILLVPVLLAGHRLAWEAANAIQQAKEQTQDGRIAEVAGQVPYGRSVVEWVRRNVDVPAEARKAVGRFTGDAAAVAQGSAWLSIQLLVCVFVLFFVFRDWRKLLADIRGLLPLTRDEADYLFHRVADSVNATVYATVLTSTLQGVTGGLLFWVLSLPAPLLWGVVMIVLGIIPVLGAFLVWVPAAAYLATEGQWGSAVVLVVWGVLMAGPVSNFAYGHLAGGRLRLHPVPVLIAFVGGLAVFGISGMVLGPAILAVTLALVDVWRRRLTPDQTLILPDTKPADSLNGAGQKLLRPGATGTIP